uniref:Uncharacterized protein n=1 Tax=Rhodnius prolixus TaxID=13249 RepID=T1IDY5_RHOPR
MQEIKGGRSRVELQEAAWEEESIKALENCSGQEEQDQGQGWEDAQEDSLRYGRIPFPDSRREIRNIPVVKDHFSKRAEAHDLAGQDSSPAAAASAVYQILGVRRKRTTPLHPHSDGMVERIYRTLEGSLEAEESDVSGYVAELRRKWRAARGKARGRKRLDSDRTRTSYDRQVIGRTFRRGEEVLSYKRVRKKGKPPKLLGRNLHHCLSAQRPGVTDSTHAQIQDEGGTLGPIAAQHHEGDFCSGRTVLRGEQCNEVDLGGEERPRLF